MIKPPRGLSPDEAALWARLAQTVRPLAVHSTALVQGAGRNPPPPPKPRVRRSAPAVIAAASLANPAQDLRNSPQTLDASWDRKLSKAAVQPDFTLDLHGHSLASAHARLDHGLTLALAQGARLVLLITGRPRPSDDHAGRSDRRGAIRAKYIDWLAAGPHASRIAAIRPAHPRHGGAGAVYIVLRRAG